MFSFKARASGLQLLTTLFSLLLLQAQGRPIQLPSWLTNALPEKGATVADEIKCYSLPYGGIGFLSHVLTYWTILVLGFGRRPYWPWRKLSAGPFDLFLSMVQLVITVAIASFTIARCRSRWQFVLIAVWKLVMSAVVGVWGISASRNAIKASKYELLAKSPGHVGLDELQLPRTYAHANPPGYMGLDEPWPPRTYARANPPSGTQDRATRHKAPRIWSSEDGTWWTLVIYAAAAAVGLVGLISLVVENFWIPRVWKITTVFGSLILGTGLGFLALWWCLDSEEEGARKRHSRALLRGLGFSSLAVVPTLMLILAAFYSDWVLGALAGNLVGVPSSDNAYLYWVNSRLSPLFHVQLVANWGG